MKIALNMKKGRKVKFKNKTDKIIRIKEEGYADAICNPNGQKTKTVKTKGKRVNKKSKPRKPPSRRKDAK